MSDSKLPPGAPPGETPPLAFAVVNGAAVPRLGPTLDAFDTPRVCLFVGALPADMRDVAPWLVALPTGSPTESWWREHQTAGMAGEAACDFVTLRRHWRSLLRVRLAGHGMALFRFFDPRVLARVLPLFDDAQKRRFFGPVTRLCFAAHGANDLFTHADAPTDAKPHEGAWTPLAFTQAQIDALDAQADGRFETRLAKLLTESMPKEVAKLGQRLGARVRAGRTHAAAHGVEDERGIARWMILDLAVGAGFFKEPTVQRLFAAEGEASPSDRLGALVSAVLTRVGEGK